MRKPFRIHGRVQDEGAELCESFRVPGPTVALELVDACVVLRDGSGERGGGRVIGGTVLVQLPTPVGLRSRRSLISFIWGSRGPMIGNIANRNGLSSAYANCDTQVSGQVVVAFGDINRDAVLKAVAEYDELGQEQFLDKYGFERARLYVLVHGGKPYDSRRSSAPRTVSCQDKGR